MLACIHLNIIIAENSQQHMTKRVYNSIQTSYLSTYVFGLAGGVQAEISGGNLLGLLDLFTSSRHGDSVEL